MHRLTNQYRGKKHQNDGLNYEKDDNITSYDYLYVVLGLHDVKT